MIVEKKGLKLLGMNNKESILMELKRLELKSMTETEMGAFRCARRSGHLYFNNVGIVSELHIHERRDCT